MNPFTLFIIGILQAILLLLLAPLYSGFARVMRAKMHSRTGPPLMQNYRDIRKLMTRQEVVSEQAGWIFRVTPYVNLACMFLAAMVIPALTTASPLEAAGDLILIVYLFALPRFFLAVAGLESGSSLAGIGARRELLVSALAEPILLLVIFVMALLTKTTNLGRISTEVATGAFPFSLAFVLGLAAFAFAAYIEMGKLPFDLGEAEQELQEGPLAEYSGRSLAILKWSVYLKQLVLVALFMALFIPFGAMTELSIVGFILALIVFPLKAALWYFIAAIFENAMARTRFMNAPAVVWMALGMALLSFVFYLANV
ncbi:MAG: hydrogenase [Anaerolineaceae bacterium]|nr:MAG: NADH-quinone oxidoreductase subunit H [Anaerolineales bacterium]GIK08487.1 MAG: hydrogenase [Chloroflexota bacterium]GJQ38363.1 MAG: hydrogenase [Anaerolineaceae bacterium]HMM98987.1 NADH-quinone oxidoreductase subunit H [Anaerolineales bacterium]HPP62417.1 NADH-quinone oxidoreductase subunit H [Anaerolineales bacterium]